MTEAERRAFNRGLEAAAKTAGLYAEEFWRMCNHTILADPILSGRATARTILRDRQESDDLCLEGHGHANAAHAAQNIAKAIRKLKVNREGETALSKILDQRGRA